jgi:hypothetical protein
MPLLQPLKRANACSLIIKDRRCGDRFRRDAPPGGLVKFLDRIEVHWLRGFEAR